jgi:ketosteroid isomerase-like protein
MPRSPLVPLLACTLALHGCATAPASPEPPAQASLVAAERAFAREALDRGVRAAFLANFDPAGLMFVPAPMRVGDVFAEAPADPMATLLEWAPAASGVAASGDFGFTTGPAKISRRDGSRAPGYNTFFSVWKRAGEGPWRVVLDAGVSAPGPVPPERLQPAPAVHAAARGAEVSAEALTRLESAVPWTREAMLARLAPDAQVQRAGTLPVQGAAAIAAAWPDGEERLRPLGGDVAASGDLAYTFGEVASPQGTGHYVHLWTRDEAGRAWRIGVALRLP